MATAPSPASVQSFAAHGLPVIVDGMAGGWSRVATVQALGAALVYELCLPAVELTACEPAGEGLLFVGAATEGRAELGRIVSPSGRLRLVAGFEDAEHRAWLTPVLRSALALVDLDPDTPTSESAAASRPTDLPSPRTLDTAVDGIYAQARSLAAGDIPVLVRGPSGSGKEVLASYLHRVSPRAEGPFLGLNCAALPRDLLEAELFGVERGVATGVEARPGLFERADRGTLMLDEVGDMAADTQAKMLRVMQEGEVRRLGGAEVRPADVRVVAATNRDLEAMIEAGAFRRDLYHRLSGWEVTLPALADRRADIVNLAVFFLDRELGKLDLRAAGIAREAADMLAAAPWPGNIRQLERAMVRSAFFLEDRQPLGEVLVPPAARPPLPPEQIEGLEPYLESVERRAIEEALAVSSHDIGTAARRLDVGRSTLYRRIKHLGIEVGG